MLMTLTNTVRLLIYSWLTSAHYCATDQSLSFSRFAIDVMSLCLYIDAPFASSRRSWPRTVWTWVICHYCEHFVRYIAAGLQPYSLDKKYCYFIQAIWLRRRETCGIVMRWLSTLLGQIHHQW